jgi:hypothetical protein
MGDVVEGDAEATQRKEFTGGVEDPLPVELGIPAQWLVRVSECDLGHDSKKVD